MNYEFNYEWPKSTLEPLKSIYLFFKLKKLNEKRLRQIKDKLVAQKMFENFIFLRSIKLILQQDKFFEKKFLL